jgi:hypothetical protein
VFQTIGYLGSAGAAVMWIPQASRVIRRRHDLVALAGISAVSYATAMMFNALLLAYGLVNGAGPVVLAGCMNLGCATVILGVVGYARRRLS